MHAESSHPIPPPRARGRAAVPVPGRIALAALLALGWWAESRGEAEPLRTFSGHGSAVSSVAFAPDGERIISGSFDGTARLWNARTAETLRVLDDHDGWVRAVAFAPDGSAFLTAGDDGKVRVREGTTAETRHVLAGHDGSVSAALFHPDGAMILTAGADATVRLWNAETGDLIRSLTGHNGEISAAAFSPDGTRVLTGDRNETVRLWQTSGGESIHTFHGHTGPVTAVGFLGAGGNAFSTGLDGTVRIWNTATGEETRRFDTAGVTSAAALGAPAVVLAGDSGGRAVLRDVVHGDTVRTFEGHGGTVGATAFSPDGLTLLTGGGDGEVKLWKTFPADYAIRLSGTLSFGTLVVGESQERLLVIRNNLAVPLPLSQVELPEGFSISGIPDLLAPGHMRAIEVTFSPSDEQPYDGKVRIRSESLAGDVRHPITGTGLLFEPYFSVGTDDKGFFAAAFSRDGTSVLAGGEGQPTSGWNLANGDETLALDGHEQTVYSIAISPDGSRILTGSGDRTVRLWDAASGETVRIFEGHANTVAGVAFSPDGTRIATAGLDETVKIWNPESGELLHDIPAHNRWAMAVAFSPDGQSVLSGGGDATARLWHARTGELLRSFEEGNSPVNAVVFTPGGERILTGGRDGDAVLWDRYSGEVVKTIPVTESWVTSLDISPDEKHFLTGSLSGEVTLRDLKSGDLLRTFRAHDQAVRAVRFSPDGKRILSASPDGYLRVWDVVLNPPVTYEHWSETISRPEKRGPADTPFGDGTSNLLKYALGLPSDAPLPAKDAVFGITPDSDGRIQLEFARHVRRYDTTLTVEVSQDLESWQPVARASGAGPFLDLGREAVEVTGDLGRQTVRITGKENQTDRPSLFFRLRVSKH